MSTQITNPPESLFPAVSNDELLKVAAIWETSNIPGLSAPPLTEIDRTDVQPAATRVSTPLPSSPLAYEQSFYGQYSWCINPFPQLRHVAQHLSLELSKLDKVDGWQYSEVVTNIFLLSCAITDTIDDYLLGSTLDFAKLVKVLPITAPAIRVVQHALEWRTNMRGLLLSKLSRWRETWGKAVTDFLQHAVVNHSDRTAALNQRTLLSRLLATEFDSKLAALRPKVPAFFRSRDFATQDCLKLAHRFVAEFSPCNRPAIVVGLRTAGSFLAPLTCACLRAQGLETQWTTIRPTKGLASRERRELELAAKRHSRALIADESVHSGQTLAKSISLLRRAGFAEEDIVVLNPVEPALPDWKNSRVLQSLRKIHVVVLEPKERYKCRLLDSQTNVQDLLTEYFVARGYSDVRLAVTDRTEKINSIWRDHPPQRVDHRLKRIYEVHLASRDGSREVRYVLAKSVGWGWLGYHAFIAGQRLAKWTAPILGLRDGILYSEWLPSCESITTSNYSRSALIDSLASYVAGRTKHLALEDNPVPHLVTDDRHKGVDLLCSHLIRAYGSRFVASAIRPKLRRLLAQQNPSTFVMTDSSMVKDDWIIEGDSLKKTDFEHHCFGKNELSITDPAFDLASAMLHFELSENESQQLIKRYVEQTGDNDVGERLFLNKLLASIRVQSVADHDIGHPRLSSQRHISNRQYISAWNFLISESARECGKLCVHPAKVDWHRPLVVADIDGVLDRMVFGFPCTTASGIKALSLLHAHGFCIAVNTARTLHEVKHYCRAYSFAGGVAEYGAVIWDAVSNRESVTVDQESLEQLEKAREAFRRVPGLFLNDDYLYSLRVFTYQGGRTGPIPALLAQDLLSSINGNRLRVHHTGLDTAIVAKSVDKGVGLLSLLNFVGLPNKDIVAIGDSEPDLAMFRIADRSCAPGNVTCRKEADLLGCFIANSGFQSGLLEIAKRLVHPNGETCDLCKTVHQSWPKHKNLFVSLLEIADEKPLSLLLHNFYALSFLAPFKK